MLAHRTTTAMTIPADGPSAAEEIREQVVQHFRAHGAALYRFSCVLLHNPQDAEDVVQETFLKLLKHLQAGAADCNLRGWLFTVAAHGCRDRQRLRRRWLPWAPSYDRAVPAAEGLAEAEDRQILESSLRRLAQRDRLLLALRAEGLSYREIAAAIGIHVGSVGSLLARALVRWEREYSAQRDGRTRVGDASWRA
jgi:RNA polymerase sigma-70 factor, ECF subfamily